MLRTVNQDLPDQRQKWGKERKSKAKGVEQDAMPAQRCGLLQAVNKTCLILLGFPVKYF